MEFDFSVQNIVDGQAVAISITGMVVVFCVLLMLSLFIGALPRVLAALHQVFPEKAPVLPKPDPASVDAPGGDETVAAIAVALHHRRRS